MPIALAALLASSLAVGAIVWQLPGPPPCKYRDDCDSACDEGDDLSCDRYSRMLQQGIGGPPEYTKAAQLDLRLCDHGLADACSRFASSLRFGLGIERDVQRSRQLHARACDMGSAAACSRLAIYSTSSDPSSASAFDLRAQTLWSEDCGAGNDVACVAAHKDVPAALDRLKTACLERDDVFACHAWIVQGDVRNQDLLVRRKPECELEDAMSCFFAGTIDENDRARLWKRACDFGNSVGCRALARLARNNQEASFPRPPELEQRALELDKAGCEQNDLSSCAGLARAVDTTASTERAFQLAIENCQLADWTACDTVVDLAEANPADRYISAQTLEAIRNRACGLQPASSSCRRK